MSELKKTALYDAHVAANGKIVDFSGWALPIHYGSQIQEHEAVRTDAGMFDISHMLVTDVVGKHAKAWLQKLLANDVAKLTIVGKALYSPMLNQHGGVIDDLIVYLISADETQYRIVSNGATREKDSAHFEQTSMGMDVKLTQRLDLAMLAVQGPNAISKLSTVKPHWQEIIAGLKPFQAAILTDDQFVARTGYTGEEGVEVIMPVTAISAFFNQLKDAGIAPCGLGARDTLRLEAGMNLYGHDMDDEVSPLEAGMAWTIAWSEQRDFIGKSALLEQKQNGLNMKQVGLLLESRAVLRDGMEVIVGDKKGIITSGSFSPSLKRSIAIARVPVETTDTAQVNIRNVLVDVRVLALPFVRHGKKQFD